MEIKTQWIIFSEWIYNEQTNNFIIMKTNGIIYYNVMSPFHTFTIYKENGKDNYL